VGYFSNHSCNSFCNIHTFSLGKLTSTDLNFAAEKLSKKIVSIKWACGGKKDTLLIGKMDAHTIFYLSINADFKLTDIAN
jgi:hypothetical protein